MLMNHAVESRFQPHRPVSASQRLCHFLIGQMNLMVGAMLPRRTPPSPSLLGSLLSNMPSRWLVANLFLQVVTQ